jgi:hypothetical protein
MEHAGVDGHHQGGGVGDDEISVARGGIDGVFLFARDGHTLRSGARPLFDTTAQ